MKDESFVDKVVSFIIDKMYLKKFEYLIKSGS